MAAPSLTGNPLSGSRRLPAAAGDDRMIAGTRLGLALSALAVIYLDPLEPGHFAVYAYAVLLLYTLYSSILYGLALGRHRYLRMTRGWLHWVDVSWYTLLVALSNGTTSVFFLGFLFTILFASFRRGFKSGMRVSAVSAVLFMSVAYVVSPAPAFELNRFLLRPVYLLFLGYMTAHWGGSEILLKRRLALLKNLTRLSNPRLGTDHTLNSILEQLCRFYDADTALLVLEEIERAFYHVRSPRRGRNGPPRVDAIKETLPQKLLSLSDEHALLYSSRRSWRWGLVKSCHAYDVQTSCYSEISAECCEDLAVLLDADSFVTIPLSSRGRVAGRLFLATRGRRPFGHSDIEFLLLAAEHFMSVVDYVKLVDDLMLRAEEEERQRIARDLHDSVIQPFIGLQMGLTGVRRKLGQPGADVSTEIERLIEMTNDGLSDLRHYVMGIREHGSGELDFVAALRRFAAKFSAMTGVAVVVECESGECVSGLLAAELFQVTVEGLSNIRRHTVSKHATLKLQCHADALVLQIENDDRAVNGDPLGPPPAAFSPRSITERVAALGGKTVVTTGEGGRTVVRVEVPL